MKLKFILVFTAALIPFFISAQTAGKGQIGLTYSVNGGTSVLQPALEGSASHTVTNATGIGLIYLKPLSSWLEFETGINYSLYKIKTTSAPIPEVFTTNSSMSLIDIPAGLRATFWKYVFVNGGLLLDMDVMNNSSVSGQTGIGLMLGGGLKYDFKFGGSLFIHPYGKLHSLLPFGSWKNHDRILESGIRFGVMYRL